MKDHILNVLCAGCLITSGLYARPMDNPIQDGMMGSNMMQHMREVTEEDLLDSLNNKDIIIYQQLNPEQKALVLKAANQFSCEGHMQRMHQRMRQQEMMNK